MKQLSGTSMANVNASAQQCMKVLAAVERYPDWYPEVVRRVEVLERDAYGQATKARTSLHVTHGPVSRDFELTLDVKVQQPDQVRLVRIPHEPTDEERFEVNWHVRDGATRRIELELDAALPVPRFLPVGTIGDAMARGFVVAAAREVGRSG